MSTIQIDKLKKLAAADSTPEEIRKELIEILAATQIQVPSYIPYTYPIGTHYPYYQPWTTTCSRVEGAKTTDHITVSGHDFNWVVE